MEKDSKIVIKFYWHRSDFTLLVMKVTLVVIVNNSKRILETKWPT